MSYEANITLEIESKSENESFARTCVAVFVSRLDPNMEEISDIKTAVSEAVTNCIIHGYRGKVGIIRISCSIQDRTLTVAIEDSGAGIADIPKAMEPLFTTAPELERSGMGFAFMEAFMDELEVTSEIGKGTKVLMRKRIAGSNQEEES